MPITTTERRRLGQTAKRFHAIREFQLAYTEKGGFDPEHVEQTARWYHHLFLPLGFAGLLAFVCLLYWARNNL